MTFYRRMQLSFCTIFMSFGFWCRGVLSTNKMWRQKPLPKQNLLTSQWAGVTSITESGNDRSTGRCIPSCPSYIIYWPFICKILLKRTESVPIGFDGPRCNIPVTWLGCGPIRYLSIANCGLEYSRPNDDDSANAAHMAPVGGPWVLKFGIRIYIMSWNFIQNYNILVFMCKVLHGNCSPKSKVVNYTLRRNWLTGPYM